MYNRHVSFNCDTKFIYKTSKQVDCSLYTQEKQAPFLNINSTSSERHIIYKSLKIFQLPTLNHLYLHVK